MVLSTAKDVSGNKVPKSAR